MNGAYVDFYNSIVEAPFRLPMYEAAPTRGLGELVGGDGVFRGEPRWGDPPNVTDAPVPPTAPRTVAADEAGLKQTGSGYISPEGAGVALAGHPMYEKVVIDLTHSDVVVVDLTHA